MANNQNFSGKGKRNDDRITGSNRTVAPYFQLPKGYLKDGYFHQLEGCSRPVLRKEYILGYPKEIADGLGKEARAQRFKKDQNKSSQIRKFYDFCVRIRDKIDEDHPFVEMEPKFLELDAKVEKAHSRELVTRLFVDFIQRNVECVSNEPNYANKEEYFRAFVRHFEAMIAHLKPDRGRG